MSYRQVLIAKKAELSTKDNQLVVKQSEHENKIPLADISILVVESCEVRFTANLMASLSSFGIVTLFCDEYHMPNTYTMPLNKHYRPYDVFQLQIKQTETDKSVFAEALIKGKIRNQTHVMRYCRRDNSAVELMKKYEIEVKGNDESNREGTAAKVFFNALYGDGFTRFDDDFENAVMNYGYAILRSSISRVLMSFGFTLFIGVNHIGKTNPLNLTYDMIEPFRPIIDYYLFNNRHRIDQKLNLSVRKELIHLLNAPVIIKKRQYTLQYAIELLIKSYLRFLEEGVVDFHIPEIKKIDFDMYYESI